VWHTPLFFSSYADSAQTVMPLEVAADKARKISLLYNCWIRTSKTQLNLSIISWNPKAQTCFLESYILASPHSNNTNKKENPFKMYMVFLPSLGQIRNRFPGCLAQANNNDKLLSDHNFCMQTMRLFNMHPRRDHGGGRCWCSFVFDFGVPAIFPMTFSTCSPSSQCVPTFS
jgi:hypothetical protein